MSARRAGGSRSSPSNPASACGSDELRLLTAEPVAPPPSDGERAGASTFAPAGCRSGTNASASPALITGVGESGGFVPKEQSRLGGVSRKSGERMPRFAAGSPVPSAVRGRSFFARPTGQRVAAHSDYYSGRRQRPRSRAGLTQKMTEEITDALLVGGATFAVRALLRPSGAKSIADGRSGIDQPVVPGEGCEVLGLTTICLSTGGPVAPAESGCLAFRHWAATGSPATLPRACSAQHTGR